MATFTSTAPYIPAHPSALAMYCSDGRFTRPVEELLRELGHARLDTLTLPGGAGLLNATNASRGDLDTTLRAAGFLIVGHAINDIFLIAHEGCGYYRARSTRPAAELTTIQITDLHVATTALERAHPGVMTHRYYASVVDNRVRFEAV